MGILTVDRVVGIGVGIVGEMTACDMVGGYVGWVWRW